MFSKCSAYIYGRISLRWWKWLAIDLYKIPQSGDKVCLKKYLLKEGPYHIETSPLICSANQWTAFYMIGTSVIKHFELKHFVKATTNTRYQQILVTQKNHCYYKDDSKSLLSLRLGLSCGMFKDSLIISSWSLSAM